MATPKKPAEPAREAKAEEAPKEETKPAEPQKPAEPAKEAKASGKGANIENLYGSPLCLAGGPTIAPGATAHVENWDTIKDHQVTKAWLEAEVIKVVK